MRRQESTEGKTPVLEDLSMYQQARTPQDSHYYVDDSNTRHSKPKHSRHPHFAQHNSVDLDEDVPIAESDQEDLTGNTFTSIRVINKDMTSQFRGRSQSTSVSVARIRWFENRKSQILGFCLCMAMLGITLAFYEWRWAGLVAGSALTLMSGSAVVYTYFRRKRWHQHPNPIVHMRTVLSMFLAICLLVNVVVDYQPSDSANLCRNLAGITEFFVITSEAWGLMMAFDLFSSLMSPFANYKRQMVIYHFWVWTLGITMAIVTWSVTDAAGFFRVDGQKIFSAAESNDLVGFCLASSQPCCSSESTDCPDNIPSCSSSNFLSAQKWPWLLVYSFVLFVLIVSVTVLMLAWHRLYLRGVPKTYHIRLRVLNYVSFFTGAYVFYWLLLLLLYMTAYFISSKEADDTPSTGAAAQVLRQVVIFVIASKGYLDYVIWFAVNSIEWGQRDRRQNDRNESADVDVDLSPQVNTALRSEILYYTTTGITQSVSDAHRTTSGRGRQEVFYLGSGDPKDRQSKKIKFWSYSPHTFRAIREFFGISDAEYVKMFSATTKERFSEGRSGAFMFFTADERLIVKTMSSEECNFLRKIARDYSRYLMGNSRSFLTRFYGCHAVALYGKTYYFVVMGNLFAETGVIHHRYDIKGSWVARNASHPKPGGRAHCRYCNASYTYGSKRNQECGDGFNYHEPDIVLKDNDLLTKIRIDPNQADTLYDQLCNDSEFLCKCGIMDYSLLMGVQSCEYYVEPGSLTARRMDETAMQHAETPNSYGFRTKIATSVNGPALYHFGVIDFLQQWTFEKKAERFYKTMILRKDPDGLSALPPKPYMMRFQRKMAQIFAVSTTKPGGQHEQQYDDMQYIQSGLLDVLDQGPRNTQLGLTPEGANHPLLRDGSNRRLSARGAHLEI